MIASSPYSALGWELLPEFQLRAGAGEAGLINGTDKEIHASFVSNCSYFLNRLRSILPPLIITPIRASGMVIIPSSKAAAAKAPVGSTTIFRRSHKKNI
ncbi:MAG: hypothetical protein F6K58_31860 [Symploca sp. SIO2E9]|nr:hypothetical protein [Symploca sp. SIO2E9]